MRLNRKNIYRLRARVARADNQTTPETLDKRIAPGRVMIHNCGDGKSRPWLILQVDDVETEPDDAMCLVVAFTSTGLRGKGGLIETGNPAYPLLAMWVKTWPAGAIHGDRVLPGVYFDERERKEIRRKLREGLDLED